VAVLAVALLATVSVAGSAPAAEWQSVSRDDAVEIEARARPEGGSVFTIRLPIAAGVPAETRPPAERPSVEPPIAVG